MSGRLYKWNGPRRLIPSQPDMSVRAFTSERFTVNMFDHPDVPAITGSLAGFEYILPPLQVLRPVVAIRAYTRERSQQTGEFIDSAGNVQSYAVPADLSAYYITLREPDGKYILNMSPLASYQVPISAAAVRGQWPRFIAHAFVDPRQSFIVCTQDNRTELLPIEFLYR